MCTQVPYVLSDAEIVNDIMRLNSAWDQARTFALIGDRSGIEPAWITQQLMSLPEEYRTNHFILLTSGSTGNPKLVVGSRERALRLVTALHEIQESEPVTETICALPLTYCYAFVNQWLWAREYNRRFIITDGFAKPDRLEAILNSASNAMICLVGAQVSFLESFFQASTFPGIIRLHFAGGRFPQERLEFLYRIFPNARIFNNYGCAEAMPRLTIRTAEAGSLASHIGWPLPQIRMRSDTEGRIHFISPYGAVGLIDDTGLTRLSEFTWIATGDLGHMLEDGHWELLGREGEVFKRYGEKVSIVQGLSTVRAIWHGQADYYRETDHRGEEGYVLVLAPHPSEAEVLKILKRISLTHQRAHWPLRIESVDYLPLLQNGKTDRKYLKDHASTQSHWRQRV